MQVEWYRTFTETAKSGSLSKAAEKLNLTQPAVSKHIRHLETAFGVELFRRGTAGVELTEAGKLFLNRITPVVEAIASIEAELRPFAERPRLVLGSLPSVAAQVLPERLRDHNTAGLPISVSVRPSSTELLSGLQEGTFDAVLVDATYTGGRLWRQELFTENYVVVMPEGYPLQGATALKVSDLAQEPFVFISCCDSEARFVAAAERYGYRPDVRLTADNNDYLLGVVAVGTGITILPELFRKQAERLGLRTVPLHEDGFRRTIVLAARTASIGSKLYRLLDGDRPHEKRERGRSELTV